MALKMGMVSHENGVRQKVSISDQMYKLILILK